MSFASGFAAGSAAVERGLNLKERREKREREDAYQKGLADLNQKYTGSQQAQADYNASVPVQQGAVASGPITSAAGLNPMAQAGIAAPADPNVQRTVTGVAAAPTGMGATPTGMGGPQDSYSFRDYQRDAAQLALSSGDQKTGLALLSQLQQEDQFGRRMGQVDERLALMQDRFSAELDQFADKLQLSEDQLKSLDDYRGASEAYTAQQTANLFAQSEYDATVRGRNIDTFAGQDALAGLQTGQSINEIYSGLEKRYTDADGNTDQDRLNVALRAAASGYFKDYLNMNEGQVASVSSRAISPLQAAISKNSGDTALSEADFINSYQTVLNDFVDPDFSDGIETKLRQVKNPDGDPTGRYQLMYGNDVRQEFASRDEINQFATAELNKFQRSPYSVVSWIDNQKVALGTRIKRAKDTQEREKLMFTFLEKNPHMVDKEMELRQLYGLSSGLETSSRFGGTDDTIVEFPDLTPTPTPTPTPTLQTSDTRYEIPESMRDTSRAGAAGQTGLRSELAELERLEEKYPNDGVGLLETSGSVRRGMIESAVARKKELQKKFGLAAQ